MHDVVVVGASLAGSATAALYGRRGLDVALLERSADPRAYKTVCTTFIQAGATHVIERLGLVPGLEAAGAVRNGVVIWTRWGWVVPEPDPRSSRSAHGWNVRRETLDPMLRGLAAATPGVQLQAGSTVTGVLREHGRVSGVVARDRDGESREVRGRLVVGADGRASRVAEAAGVPRRERANGRIAYAAHYRNVPRVFGTRSQMWLLDPDAAYVFPQDDGVTILATMPSADRLAEFRADPEGALLDTFARLPDAPSLDGIERVSKVIGRVDMTSYSRRPAEPGLALVGDAAMASDPLWGVGCGFALQSAEWLVDATAAALAGSGDLDRALARYARIHRLRLTGHHLLMADYSSGRPFNPLERLLYSAAPHDQRVARQLEAFGTRQIGPVRLMAPHVLARAATVGIRRRSGGARNEAIAA